MKKIIVLFGPRGGGKSTMQKHLINQLEKEIGIPVEKVHCYNEESATEIFQYPRDPNICSLAVEIENGTEFTHGLVRCLGMLLYNRKAFLFFHVERKESIDEFREQLRLHANDIEFIKCDYWEDEKSQEQPKSNIAEFDQDKEYKTWEMRAECEDDVYRFFNILDLKLHKFIIIPDTIFPDVRVVFQTEQPTLIASLYELFKPIDDSHVMYQTLAPAHAYTGERDYSLAV